MWDSILGLVGQSAKQAALRDMDDYDPSTGSVGEREGLEAFGDVLRGGSGSVDKAAREAHVKQLKKSAEAKAIRRLQGKPDITSSTTEDDLYAEARKLQLADKKTQRNDARAEQFTSPEAEYLRNQTTIQRQDSLDRADEADRRYDASRLDAIDARRSETALGMAQLDITRQQEANRMSEETRRYDQRRADSKKERMAAIIAGLANLGGAFAI